jgi:hypothetical protein
MMRGRPIPRNLHHIKLSIYLEQLLWDNGRNPASYTIESPEATELALARYRRAYLRSIQ